MKADWPLDHKLTSSGLFVPTPVAVEYERVIPADIPGARTPQGAETFMILFLDFDGVLHRFGDRIADYCRFLPRLEAVLRDYPDVKIVVSSDWRKHHTLEELQGFFSADIAKRVIGVAPNLLFGMNPQDQTGIRHYEALAWMARNEFTGPWVALDDDPWNWLADDPHFIFCDDGFEEIEELALRRHLQANAIVNK